MIDGRESNSLGGAAPGIAVLGGIRKHGKQVSYQCLAVVSVSVSCLRFLP